METSDLLAERAKTHGDFRENTCVMQAIKRIIRNQPNYALMSDPQREALDMIAHKIGRIVRGDPNHKDHWDDIAGYAQLVARDLK